MGVIVLILRRLPEAQKISEEDLSKLNEKLNEKGIPAKSFSRIVSFIKFWLHRVWVIALEAKDLKTDDPSAYKLKRFFKFRLQKTQKPPVLKAPGEGATSTAAPGEEQVLLEKIKQEPKNFSHYETLGKLYLKQENYADARDIFTYLVGHVPGNPDFHAKLAHSSFCLGDFKLSAQHYQKSLDLDKMHPNRYYNLGLALERLEKYEQAKEAFKKALEMDPENPKYADAANKVD